MRRYLVVANQTLDSEELAGHLREVLRDGPCELHILVPATPPREHLTWTEGEARAIAATRLDAAIARWRSEGAEVTGEVGDASPHLAVDDVLRERTFDEAIVSTFPIGVSRWLKRSLPERIERNHHLPVTHLVTQPQTAPG